MRCDKFLRFCFILSLCVAAIIACIVLGLDLDLLKNGPKYLSQIISKITKSDGTDPTLLQDLEQAQGDMWVHVPMVVVVIICTIILIMCFVGFLGACFLSYSLLSGYVIFNFVAFVIMGAAILWIFLNNLEDSLMMKFVLDKMDHYNGTTSFDIIIDYTQSFLQCCGIRYAADWKSSYPTSCCPQLAMADGCLGSNCTVPCTDATVYTTACLEAFREHMLDPVTFIGGLGMGLLCVTGIVLVNFLLALCLCIIARKRSCKEWVTPDSRRHIREEQEMRGYFYNNR